jgi:hypothetical protein
MGKRRCAEGAEDALKALQNGGLRIKKGGGGMRPRGADAPWAQKIVDGIWKMGLSRTKPLGSGAVDYRR